MGDAEKDALLGAAIKSIEELEALIVMIRVAGGLDERHPRSASISTQMREIAALLDQLPLLQNDLYTVKKRLRGLLSSDPDKTPRGMLVPSAPSTPSDTEFSSVEEKTRQFRAPTKPGLGTKR